MRFVNAAGVRARVIEEGAGEPVLLVHGVGGWAENWTYTLPALASAGLRAIACDLPGFGESQRAARARYFDPQDPFYARFIGELLDALALERIHLVGHSLGGAVATVTAICFSARIRRLVLVAPGGFGEELIFAFRLTSLPVAQLVARLLPTIFVRSTVEANFADPSRAPAWVFEQAERYARAGGAVEFTRVMGQVATLRGQREDVRSAWYARAPELRMPTLVLWGRRDAILPVSQARQVKTRVPQAEVRIIEDAGHLVQIERPDEFNAALLGFLRA